jgi:hypothetical protein
MGLGHERGLELDQHSHGSPLRRLLVKLGCDERLFLGLTDSDDQKGEQHGQSERSGQSSAHADTASTAKRSRHMSWSHQWKRPPK